MSSLIDVLSDTAPVEIDITSQKASEYLNQVTSFPLSKLLSEPTNLSSTSSQLTNALTNLCASSYPTFLSLHSTASDLSSALSSFSSTLDGLLQDIPDLVSSTRTLSAEINGVQSERRRASLVLEHSTKLQDVLELPLLAEACVRNGFFLEALDLSAHATGLAARFPDVVVIQDVRAEVDGALRTLLVQLLNMLREPAKLPQLSKAVSFLRRMRVLSEDELALAFLTGRLEILQLSLNAITIERKGVEHERGKEAWIRYMKKYVDAWREGVHDIITQYTAIFIERAPQALVESMRKLLPDVTKHLLSQLLTELRTALPHIMDPNALTSLLTQLTYCATSFARFGLDFRSLLPPIFSGALARGVAEEFKTAGEQFKCTIEAGKSKPPKAWLVDGPPYPIPAEDVPLGLPHFPPSSLATYLPIAHFTNALLTTLNNLRLLAPVAILPELVCALDEVLKSTACCLLQYFRDCRFSDEDNNDVLNAVGLTFVRVFVPFIRRALIEGVYGVTMAAEETTMDAELKKTLEDLKSCL